MCDFGSCLESPIPCRTAEERQRAEESIAKETTQMYRAPEMIDLYMRPQLTEKSDIWAMGCMLFALCYLTHPFPDGSGLGILNAKICYPDNAAAKTVPPEVNTFILRMLDVRLYYLYSISRLSSLWSIEFRPLCLLYYTQQLSLLLISLLLPPPILQFMLSLNPLLTTWRLCDAECSTGVYTRLLFIIH